MMTAIYESKFKVTEKELSNLAKACEKLARCSIYGKYGVWAWGTGKIEFTWYKDSFKEMGV